jgi:hypothetical protein
MPAPKGAPPCQRGAADPDVAAAKESAPASPATTAPRLIMVVIICVISYELFVVF